MPLKKILATPPTVGEIAPDFTLQDDQEHPVTLSSFRGKHPVVLIFYPGDMTPGCTMQLCAVRDDWSKFRQHGAMVFGINHGDAESHQTFKKKYDFPFPLLIDENKRVSAMYGAIRTFFKTKTIRRTVIAIDLKGKIVYLKRGMPKDADILKGI